MISITDGQIFLQSDLFNANQRPAVDVGISVSRVGGAAQTKAMKKVAGTLKISLAQYRDMEAFAMFASDLDEASKRQLERGARLMELLRQPQYSPMPMAEQVAVIWAGTTGQLDEVPVEDVQRFEAEFLDHLRRNGTVLGQVDATGKLEDEMLEQLTSLMGQFKGTFRTASGQLLGELNAEPVDDDDIHQQKIVKQKRG